MDEFDLRVCCVCGSSLADRRRDAVACSPACRREDARVRRLQAGMGDGPYLNNDD